MREKLKVGIIGCGAIAVEKHLKSLQKSARLRLQPFAIEILKKQSQSQKNSEQQMQKSIRITGNY